MHDETARVEFFKQLCAAVPESVALPELIVAESLVARHELGSFYELLVARTGGLSSYERDYDYSGQTQKYWVSDEAEEALDHENDFKISEPTYARLAWQQQYLDYLLTDGETTKAQALVAEIEATLKGRYARPVWLRLARVRLDLRGGRIAPAINELEHLVGIKAVAHVIVLKPPSTARLNEAVALLRAEQHAREADQLLAAAYTRNLALAQYDATYFAGLARLAFKSGDAARGRMLLQTLLALGQDETRAAAEAELVAAPWLKAYAVEDTGVELPEPAAHLNERDALVVAADTAAESGQLEFAINCRERLRAVTPDDELNRIELVRLLAAAGRHADAQTNLVALLADRTATRHARWQALWLAPEIVGAQAQALTALRARVANESKDVEMLTALDALAQASAGRGAAARQLGAQLATNNPNAYTLVFRALLEQQDGQQEAARSTLVAALGVGHNAEAWSAFGLPAAAGWQRLTRAYLALKRPRAALRAAEHDGSLLSSHGQSDASTNKQDNAGAVEPKVEDASADDAKSDHNEPVVDEQISDEASDLNVAARATFQSLTTRVQLQSRVDQIELLGLLSTAAEEVGDVTHALTFEQARLALLVRDADKRLSAARIARLRAIEAGDATKRTLIVDAHFVARA